VDYVVPHQKLDRVDDWQAALSALWQQTPIPPVRLQYQAAGATHPETLIAYHVCIYYFRRGPYLCGFGQVLPASGTELDWRNYRLDRILHLQPLDWQDQTIPALLHRQHITQTLPTPEDIALRMEEAWGFDYYQPIQQLLLRFDPLWNERYIRDTLRHSTFKRVPYAEAVSLIRQQLRGKPQQILLDVLQRRSPQDAYYTRLGKLRTEKKHLGDRRFKQASEPP
jgi:CRISPR-associated protein (TIGR03985 family)